jgi:hypothetical protein
MTDTARSPASERDIQDEADIACQRILAAVSLIERSSPAILREIRDELEIEIMIDRAGRSRRRLLRLVSEYCDRRIREKERDPVPGAGAGMQGTLRALMPGRHRAPPPGGAH